MIAGSIQPSSGSCLAFILQLEGKLGLQGTAKARSWDASCCNCQESTALQHTVANSKICKNVKKPKKYRIEALAFLNYFGLFPEHYKSIYTTAFTYFKIYFLVKAALLCSPQNAPGENSHLPAYAVSLHSSTLARWSKMENIYCSDLLYTALKNKCCAERWSYGLTNLSFSSAWSKILLEFPSEPFCLLCGW